jgi:hypothetical protein
MPGTHTTEAPESYYYMLDRSFNSHAPTLLKSKRALPRKEKPGNIMASTAPVRPYTFTGSEQVQQPGEAAKSTLASPYSINGNEPGLPPTPPSNANETHNRTRINPVHTQPVKSALSRKASASTAPMDQRSPPTPDATPPGSLNVAHLSSPSGLSSTRAESFKTAREEQWSSDEEGYTPNGNAAGPVKAIKRHSSRSRDTGLGLEFEREHEDTKPIKQTPKISKRKKSSPQTQVHGIQGERLEHIPDREWDTNLMRNVTVRRKKDPLPRAQPVEDERRISEREIMPHLVVASSEEEGTEPQTPSFNGFTPERDWSARTIHRRSSDDDSTRLSMSSTIIEAIVVASPAQRRRKLRHVSKTLSLRSEAGSSAEDSPSINSNRTSLASEEPSALRLNHKQAAIVEGSRRRSGPVLQFRPATPPKALKHYRESVSLRWDADAFLNNGTQERRSSLGSGPASFTGTSKMSGSSIRQRESSAPTILTAQRSPPRDRKVTTSRPAKVQFQEPPNSLLNDNASPKTRFHSPTRGATQSALQRADSLGSQRETRSRTGSIDASLRIPQGVSTNLPTPPDVESKATGQLQPSPEKPHHNRYSVSTVEDLGHFNLDRSTARSSYDSTRLSVDHASFRNDEHAMARHLYAQTTPFSQTSDILEVSEATAVSIHPHNNKSLVVVEQTGRASAPLSQLSVAAVPLPSTDLPNTELPSTDLPNTELPNTERPNTEDYPAISVQKATPPLLFHSFPNIESPLKNPRKPPEIPLQLPAIRVLPATPAEELEESPLDEPQTLAAAPKRSLSLKERARRYSDTVVRPIIARTTSLRRTYYGRPRSPYRQQDDAQRRNNLHPLWQPRGFWDEFSDSDSDFGEPEEGASRLPPGGDTSDVPEARGGFARVLDGFRGSGGFLIGNSMGLERHGSNNRRHYISLPAGKRSVVRKTSQGTMKSIGSASRRRGSPPVDRRVWKGLGLEFHYLGVSAMRNHLREKKREKNRERIRNSIGPRFVVEGAPLT